MSMLTGSKVVSVVSLKLVKDVYGCAVYYIFYRGSRTPVFKSRWGRCALYNGSNISF